MDFKHSAKSIELQQRVRAFMDAHVFPNEAVYVEQQASGLLCPKAAYVMDTEGNKTARAEIAMIKIAGPAGMSQRTPLAYAFTKARMMRIADGPDEVHRNAIAKLELGKYRAKGGTA